MRSPENNEDEERDVEREVHRRTREPEPLDERDLGWDDEDPADRRKDPLRRP